MPHALPDPALNVPVNAAVEMMIRFAASEHVKRCFTRGPGLASTRRPRSRWAPPGGGSAPIAAPLVIGEGPALARAPALGALAGETDLTDRAAVLLVEGRHRQVSNRFNTLGHAAGLELDTFEAEGQSRVAQGPLPELLS